MSFAAPQLLWLVALAPLGALVAAWLWRRRLQATARWASRGLWRRLLPGLGPWRLAGLIALWAFAVSALGAALARPRWGFVEEEVEQKGVDLVVVLDSSLSMSGSDVHPDRLTAARVLVQQVLRALPGHRVALVQAEGDGEVLAPLTLDLGVIDLLLDSIEPASLPTPGTRLAAGVETALGLLPPDEGSQGVLLVVSDGEDHGSGWEGTLRTVADSGVVVHTLGLGTAEGSLLPLAGSSGYKTDASGEPVRSRLQPAVLERLAKTTGGLYLEAGGAGADVSPLVDAIRAREGQLLAIETVRHQRERFQWFLAAAVVFLAVHLGTDPFRRVREAVA
ncbi:MAG TPA: VWA domain-containing protein [Thermoanaerobaculia bacterium]|nr:VWA domain-containing protein [Thermoanaerobaculia bacterium]